MELVQVISGFLVFSSAIVINIFLTTKILQKGKFSKSISLLLYTFKIAFYFLIILIVSRFFGLTIYFLFGVVLSLTLFVAISIVLFFNSRKK